MLTSLFLVTAMLSAANTLSLDSAMPIHAVDGWQVDVGPGTLEVGGKTIRLSNAIRLNVPQPEVVTVTAEAHVLPLFNEKAGGWGKGTRLKSLIVQECTATGLLRPESVVVRPAAEGGDVYVLGKDYALDGLWATLGRLEGGAITAEETVYIDYTYAPARLDSLFINDSGQVRLALGTPGLGFAAPPEASNGEYLLATVWNPGNTEALTEKNLFPVLPNATALPDHSDRAERLLPKTLAKLRNGEAVTIVAWGDSVSNGGGVGSNTEAWYQNVFLRRLQARFPKADITLYTASWPGRGSKNYLDEPAGSTHDFERDVIGRKPDLVTLEWVNDAGWKGEALMAHYTMIIDRIQACGAEALILTPHLVRPDWMGMTTLKFDVDPRPYVQGLYRFSKEKNVALADGSRRWCNLWRQGIPYTSLLANAINHPDARGHALLADALMAVFPAR